MGTIRLLLALAVVLTHAGAIYGFTLTGGKVAVQAFFIISGFYMSMILNEKYINENNSYWLFLSNRLMRLFPIYWVVLLLTILCALTLGAFSNEMPVFDVYATYIHEMDFSTVSFLVLTNILLFGQDIVMFLGLDTTTGELFFAKNFMDTSPMVFNFLFIPQAWTIGLELTFYLIAPFLVRRKLMVIVPLIIASMALRFFLYKNGFNHDPWDYRFFPTELAFFLLGNISYRFYQIVRTTEVKALYSYAALIFMISFSLFFTFLHIPFRGYIYFGSFIVLLPFIFKKTKNWRIDSYIGELSYPVYISHMLVLMIVTKLNLQLNLGLSVTVVIGTLLLSVLLNELVAKKVEVVRQRRVKTVNEKAEVKQANAVL